MKHLKPLDVPFDNCGYCGQKLYSSMHCAPGFIVHPDPHECIEYLRGKLEEATSELRRWHSASKLQGE